MVRIHERFEQRPSLKVMSQYAQVPKGPGSTAGIHLKLKKMK